MFWAFTLLRRLEVGGDFEIKKERYNIPEVLIYRPSYAKADKQALPLPNWALLKYARP